MQDYSYILIIINLGLVVQICRSDKVHILLKLLLCISFLGWNAMPGLLMYIPNLLMLTGGLSEVYVRCSYYNQFFLFFAYLLAFRLIERDRIPAFLLKRDYQDSTNVFDVLVFLSLLLSIYKVIVTLAQDVSYVDRNDLANTVALGPLDILSGYAISFLLGILFLFKKKTKPLLYISCLTVVFFYYLLLTFRGGRIYIFGIVIFLLYKFLEKKNIRLLLFASVLGILSLGALPILSSLRGDTRIKVEDVTSSQMSLNSELILNEVLVKTNSVMYGSYLINADGIGNKGSMMYSSTLFALLPRFLFPSKPEPGSVDGSPEGLPSRASAAYHSTHEYNGISSNGVPASISSLWGGGWLAFILEIVSVAYLIFFINAVFKSQKPIYAGFAFSIVSFPVCILEVPLPSILIDVQRFIVFYFVLKVLFTILDRR